MANRIIGYPELFELIPQRAPALLVDRIQTTDEAGKYLAIKNVTVNEPFFSGHFPGNPIMPGVLQLEAIAQAATAAHKLEGGKGITWISKIKKMRFKNPVLPGDQLILDITLTEVTADGAEVSAVARNNRGKVCSIVTFTLGQLDENLLQPTSFTTEYPSEFEADNSEKVMDTNVVAGFIPHRFPFFFIDQATYVGDLHIIGEKLVSINEPYALSYLEGKPLVPNTVLAETCAQLGCLYMLAQPENDGKIGLFVSLEDVTFFKPAVPGDLLTIDFKLLFLKSRLGRGVCRVYRGEEQVAELTMAFAIADKE